MLIGVGCSSQIQIRTYTESITHYVFPPPKSCLTFWQHFSLTIHQQFPPPQSYLPLPTTLDSQSKMCTNISRDLTDRKDKTEIIVIHRTLHSSHGVFTYTYSTIDYIIIVWSPIHPCMSTSISLFMLLHLYKKYLCQVNNTNLCLSEYLDKYFSLKFGTSR